MNSFSALFILFLAITTALRLWLSSRQLQSALRNRDQVPAAFATTITLAAHQKAADYTIAQMRFGRVVIIFSTLLLLLITLAGGLSWLDQMIGQLVSAETHADNTSLHHAVLVICSLFLIIQLLHLPFTLYDTFVLEQQFGFNRTTAGVFIADQLRELILGLIIMLPLLYLVLWLVAHSGGLWWLYVWICWTLFSLIMLWLYPRLIAPLFNRFTPLANAQLKQRIETLLQKTGFTSKGIFVMDGSKRSGHGNAYFTGLGNNKRIVFFDTLLDSLSPEQTAAVLAHELGHFRHGHVRKRLLLMMLVSLTGLAILGWLIDQPWFYSGLGVSQAKDYLALILFMLISPVFTFPLQPLLMSLTRQHEYQADEFAAQHADAQHLIAALLKLYEENATTLTPDHLYSAFHDSHPPAPLRIAQLAQQPLD